MDEAVARPISRRSEVFGSVFRSAWAIGLGLRLLQWIIDADRDATPWVIERVVIVAVLVATGAGWLYWRYREREHATDVRGWSKTLLQLAGLFGVIYLVSTLLPQSP